MDPSSTPDLSAASFCLTFLERFPGCTGFRHTNTERRGEEPGGETPLEEDEAGVWDLATANAFELRFLAKAGPALKRYLKEKEGLQVVLITRSEKEAGLVMNPSEDKEKSKEDEKEAEERHLLALAQQDGVLMTKNRLLQLTQGLHQLFLTPNIFDYDAIVKRITDSVVKIVSRLCPFFDATDLSNIYTKPTVPFGEEWSVYIDISFEGGGDRGNLVAYPNAYRFPPRLVEAWQSTAHRKDCIYRDFYFRCFAAPPHEVVHCLQAKAKQLDSNPLFWSAEHDASFLAGSLLAAVAKEPDNADLFPQGTFEEHLVVWVDFLKHHHSRVSPSINQQYEAWRDAFGSVAPTSDVPDTPGASFYFKHRIALEGMTEEEETLKEHLWSLFENRTGDVYQNRPSNLDKIRIDPTHHDLAQLIQSSSPRSSVALARLI
ncbi:hypothetical protein QOT17_022122 [Balamuthia mandrillaris]